MSGWSVQSICIWLILTVIILLLQISITLIDIRYKKSGAFPSGSAVAREQHRLVNDKKRNDHRLHIFGGAADRMWRRQPADAGAAHGAQAAVV